jgi:apolipoprotein N-acyltransferase
MRRSLWLLAGLSGAMLSVSFPPLSFWPAAWVALVPLNWAILECPDVQSAANLGAFCRLLFYDVSLHWLSKVFGPMAAAFWCVYALFIAAHAALIKRLSSEPRLTERAGGIAWAAVIAVAWVGVEYFRAEVWPLRNSWLALGYSQIPDKPMLQAASAVGLYGLSGLVV